MDRNGTRPTNSVKYSKLKTVQNSLKGTTTADIKKTYAKMSTHNKRTRNLKLKMFPCMHALFVHHATSELKGIIKTAIIFLVDSE